MENILTSSKDISREWLTFSKVSIFLKSLFAYKTELILQKAQTFTEINFEKFYNEKGICGVILDVDDCIAPHHGSILPENIARIRELLDFGFRIVIFSNMKKTNRYSELENLGIQVITSCFTKPDSKGFQDCLGVLGMYPHEVIMIGDNYITDGGYLYIGIPFIKVAPIPNTVTGFKRWLQRKFRTIMEQAVDFQIK